MTKNTTNISIRMDVDLKNKADALFAELGMNLTTAFNIFVRQCLREGRIPFDISLNTPSNKTVSDMLEEDKSSSVNYSNLSELLDDLVK